MKIVLSGRVIVSPKMSAAAHANQCRLCGGGLTFVFEKNILGKHDVKYFTCDDCGALQTEPPYWLDEAYGNKNLSNLDTGAAQRNIHNFSACYWIAKLFGASNVVDFGGGDGLLCRLLRDMKINCFVRDKYASPTYAQGFDKPDFVDPEMVVAFEVLEHFSHPRADLEPLFLGRPKLLLLSTALYKGDGETWWYLGTESGQHIFFYTKNSLKWIAKAYGYHLVLSGGFILFLKESSPVRSLVSRLILNKVICRLLRAVVVLLPAPGIWKDHWIQFERSKQAQQDRSEL